MARAGALELSDWIDQTISRLIGSFVLFVFVFLQDLDKFEFESVSVDWLFQALKLREQDWEPADGPCADLTGRVIRRNRFVQMTIGVIILLLRPIVPEGHATDPAGSQK